MSTPTIAGNDLLKVEDLRVTFGRGRNAVVAVDKVSFGIRRGETVAIVGESGSGKSVTSLAIMGLINNDRPNERVEGRVIYQPRKAEARNLVEVPQNEMRAIRGNEIAMIFQEPMTSLNPVMTIGEQIAEAIRLHRKEDRATARERAAEALALVGIPEAKKRLNNYPHELSGGMRQRVMIAMALSCDPSLLIADEPTTALDVTIQAQIVDLIDNLRQQLGTAVLFITHDIALVAEVADRVLVMYAGRLVEAAATEALLTRPRHPYTRGLLKCIPRVDPMSDSRVAVSPIKGFVADPSNLPDGCVFHPRCAYSEAGRCDSLRPTLEAIDGDRWVRCHRWREVANAADGEAAVR